MSKENVKLFYKRLAEDRNLQDKITKANEKYAGQKIDQDAFDLILQNELLPIAKEAGFDFTLDEYKEFVQENTNGCGSNDRDIGACSIVGIFAYNDIPG